MSCRRLGIPSSRACLHSSCRGACLALVLTLVHGGSAVCSFPVWVRQRCCLLMQPLTLTASWSPHTAWWCLSPLPEIGRHLRSVVFHGYPVILLPKRFCLWPFHRGCYIRSLWLNCAGLSQKSQMTLRAVAFAHGICICRTACSSWETDVHWISGIERRSSCCQPLISSKR